MDIIKPKAQAPGEGLRLVYVVNPAQSEAMAFEGEDRIIVLAES